MNTENMVAMIRDLSDAPGVSGFEDEVVARIRRYAQGLGEISEDAMRNLYVRHRSASDGPVLQLDAHTDEVGFMVKAIRPNGLLDMIPLGGWAASQAVAHRVLVRNTEGRYIPGIIADKPLHFMTEAERKAPPELSALHIDVGASSDREVRKDYHIAIAAPVVPAAAFEYDPHHDIMIGKAFDNRLGCAAILGVLEELGERKTALQVHAAFAAQEEMGLRGATVTAQRIQPDLAIVFEGCPADDIAAEAHAVQAALKQGPMLRHIDARMITHPRFQRFALDIARSQGIPVQEGVRTGGATNAGAIHLSGKAVPVIVISIPVRYLHTHQGIASYSDFACAVQLGAEIICHLNAQVLAGF